MAVLENCCARTSVKGVEMERRQDMTTSNKEIYKYLPGVNNKRSG
jgi:ArsR family metal-binding transcriptional regulator